MQEKPLFTACNDIMDRSIVPEPIYDEHPEYIDLYYAAWQSAYTHIFTCPGAPVQTYMNEGIRCHKIWIWDTCFMVQFCRYAAKHFPGIQSLDNFYRVIHDHECIVLKVHHTDNPPLFAWTEYEYLKHTGDIERIKFILLERKYLQKHFDWLQNIKGNIQFDYSTSLTAAEYIPGKGFKWSGCPSGMDNTPRGNDDYASIYWLDLSAQQALSALYISRLAEAVGDHALASEWNAKYEELKAFVNDRFWSPAAKMYFDRKIDESGFAEILTPASAWPMLAEVCNKEQAQALADAFADPNRLGGKFPVPSVSRDDPAFNPIGEYWRGGIWMPVVYMTVKGLEKYGHLQLADDIASKIIEQQYRTWFEVTPHTIWECYSPTSNRPSTNKAEKWSRPDFCGWSALGPISLLIENRLGVRDVNALTNTIIWSPSSMMRNGIKNLMMGDNRVSFVSDPKSGSATVTCDKPFTLIYNGKTIQCPAGTTNI